MVIIPKPKSGDPKELTRGREYLRVLRKTLVRIRSLTGGLIEPHGLTGPQMLALLWIRDCEGLTQAELAIELDSDPNTVSAMIRRMMEKGLVERGKHPAQGGRALMLTVTTKGRSLVEAAQPDIDRLSLLLFKIMQGFDEREIITWLEAVNGIREIP